MKRYKTTLKLIITLSCLLLLTGNCASKTPQKTEKEEPVNKLEQLNTPIFWAEGHPGKLDRETWKIEVKGLCENPTTFTWQDLQKMPKANANARLTSVTRWSVGGVWGGVKLSDILDSVKVNPKVKYVRFWSYDLIYDTSIPIDIALKEKTILAWEFDGEFLTEDHGGPVRAFVPYLWGYKSAKSIVRIELMDKYVPGYWEQRGYTDDAEIEAGPCRDMNDNGKVKRIPDGEVKGFLD